MAKVFISATSDDLAPARALVKKALETINLEVVEQSTFETDYGVMLDRLRRKIEGCDAMIHIAGFRYGGEPDVATLPPDTPRRSYTQWEYHLAKAIAAQRAKKGKSFPIYVFLTGEDYPAAAIAPEKADDDTQRELQLAHRQRLNPEKNERIRHDVQLELRCREVQVELDALRKRLEDELRATRRWQFAAIGLAVPIVLIALGGGLVDYGCRIPGVAAFCKQNGWVKEQESPVYASVSELAELEFTGQSAALAVGKESCEEVPGAVERKKLRDDILVNAMPGEALRRSTGLEARTTSDMDHLTRACWLNTFGEIYYRTRQLEKAKASYDGAARYSKKLTQNRAARSVFALASFNAVFVRDRLGDKAGGDAVFADAISHLSLYGVTLDDQVESLWIRFMFNGTSRLGDERAFYQEIRSINPSKLAEGNLMALTQICVPKQQCPENLESELRLTLTKDDGPEHPGYVAQLLYELLISAGKTAEASELIRQFIGSQQPTSEQKAKLLSGVGNHEEYLDFLNSVPEASRTPQIYDHMAFAYFQKANMSQSFQASTLVQAFAYADKGLGLDSTSGLKLQIADKLAQGHFLQGENTEAKSWFEKIRELSEHSYDVDVRFAWYAVATAGLTEVAYTTHDSLAKTTLLNDLELAVVKELSRSPKSEMAIYWQSQIGALRSDFELEFRRVNRQANSYRAKGDFDQTKLWFQRAYDAAMKTEGHQGLPSRQNGNTLSTLINWGNFLVERGEHQGALERAEDALKIFKALERKDPTDKWILERGPEVLRLKANADEGLKRFDQAIAGFEQAALLSSKQSSGDPKLPVGINVATLDAYFCLARVLRAKGDNKRADVELSNAKEVASKYLDILPEDAWVKWLFTEIQALESGRPTTQMVVDAQQRARKLKSAGKFDIASKAFVEAFSLAEKYAQLSSTDDRWGQLVAVDILREHGEMLLNSMSKPDEAISFFKKSLEKAKHLKNEDRAWREFAPLQPLAYAYRAKGDFDQTKLWFQRAYDAAMKTEGHQGLPSRQNGNTLSTLINWGNFLVERGEHQGALERAEDALKIFKALERKDPTDKWILERGPEVLRLKANADEGLKRFDQAIAGFEQAALLSSKQSSGDPKLPVGINVATLDAYFCLARVLRAKGDNKRADVELSNAKEVASKYLDILPEDAWVKWLFTEIQALESGKPTTEGEVNLPVHHRNPRLKAWTRHEGKKKQAAGYAKLAAAQGISIGAQMDAKGIEYVNSTASEMIAWAQN
jgi:tetratricopeptide (TPR) repeat protein